MEVSSLRTPCLVCYRDIVERNCQRMLSRAESLNVALRPHVKTHKTLQGATVQTGGTKRRIVVSTLAEAQFFHEGGFDDILYAVPITMDKLEQAASLTCEMENFHILVDNATTVDMLLSSPMPKEESLGYSVFVMVDCGYHRDGVDPESEEAVDIVRKIEESSKLKLAGIYTHGGHSYDVQGAAEIKSVAEQERDSVVNFARKLTESGINMESKSVGVGSTPTCSVTCDDLTGCNEMHPGNYAYYDVMQEKIGSCSVEDIACRVFTRVIGHYPKHNMLLIDCGWTGCSKQGGEHHYGIFEGTDAGKLKIVNLKQEAGEVSSDEPIPFEKFPIGTILRLMPWHSCAASHQHRFIHVLRNSEDATVDEKWEICKGW